MSTLEFDNIKPSAGGTARKAVRGIAAAWANLNGTGTIALRDSENVSSVVDNGTGDYGFNITNAFSNTDFSVSANAGSSALSRNCSFPGRAEPTTSVLNVYSARLDPVALADSSHVNVDILGDLA